MTVSHEFCQAGHAETLKATVHGVATVLFIGMAGYNWLAYCYRHERHLLTNGIVYTFAVAYEARNTLRHVNHIQRMRSTR